MIKVISWNVLGLEDVFEKALVSRDLGTVRAGWIALQETKLRLVDSRLVNQICGHGNWDCSASINSAEGILCYWDKSISWLQNVWWSKVSLQLRVSGWTV